MLLSGWKTKLVAALGWWPFLFFSFFSRSDGEFFWSDFAIPPFILLTAAAVFRLGRATPWVASVLVVIFAWHVVPLIKTKERYFPLEWGRPPSAIVEQYRSAQRSMPAHFKERDLVALTEVGSLRLPLRDWYIESFQATIRKLRSNASDAQLIYEGWMTRGADRESEIRWASHQLRRLRDADASKPRPQG